MQILFNIPLPVRLLVIFVIAAAIASLLNAAIYAWSWQKRLVSPWQQDPEDVTPRSWGDCLPVVGWLRLRVDEHALGRGFWVRPMLIELGFALAACALYWWEVDQLGLLAPQLVEIGRLVGAPLEAVDLSAIATPLHMQYLAHMLLLALMTIATFIDFDERIIPDEITFPGVLLGLLLMAAFPLALLPTLDIGPAVPATGVELTGQGGAGLGGAGRLVYWEPAHVASPNSWPQLLEGRPNRWSLLIGLSCFWLWGVALTDRRWPRRDRFSRNLKIIAARVRRDLKSPPLIQALLAGTLLISMVWYSGGAHWLGLLSSLVGMIVGGVVVWAVRVIGTAVLKKEAMGFGDVTLMMMVGAFLGWQACPIIFFLAPLAGILLAVVNLLLRGDHAIPYGPFLCLAAVFVVLFWGDIWVYGYPIFSLGFLVPAVLVVCFVMMGVLLGLLQMLKALVGIRPEENN